MRMQAEALYRKHSSFSLGSGKGPIIDLTAGKVQVQRHFAMSALVITGLITHAPSSNVASGIFLAVAGGCW